jgi:hypothetical protein
MTLEPWRDCVATVPPGRKQLMKVPEVKFMFFVEGGELVSKERKL